MHWLELRIPPPLVAAVVAASMYGLVALLPTLAVALPHRGVLVACLAVLGATVALAGVAAFRRQRTTLNPMTPDATTTIVTGGIYRWTRNPMYLGLLLALGAWAAHLSNVAAVVPLPVFILYMNRFQIRPEERALLALFGAPYQQYLADVRRWV